MVRPMTGLVRYRPLVFVVFIAILFDSLSSSLTKLHATVDADPPKSVQMTYPKPDMTANTLSTIRSSPSNTLHCFVKTPDVEIVERVPDDRNGMMEAQVSGLVELNNMAQSTHLEVPSWRSTP
ncbi:hypothetical protein GE09DRAFT_1099044 [Coniochaeta sp. 2T2.1]|nr:hypothetical protein GE09DRAFT_1099044 [Coniochaeta sp. 2T2.1]